MAEYSEWYKQYQEYIQHSPLWQSKRRACLDRADYTCEECGATATQVHHLTYANLYNELPEDLEAVCYSCHQDIHKHKGKAQREWVARKQEGMKEFAKFVSEWKNPLAR